jgi:hypothetical protein
MTWIKDRLPPHPLKEVIVHDATFERVTTGYWSDRGWRVGTDRRSTEVDAWMPLPEFPNAQHD